MHVGATTGGAEDKPAVRRPVLAAAVAQEVRPEVAGHLVVLEEGAAPADVPEGGRSGWPATRGGYEYHRGMLHSLGPFDGVFF